VRLGAHGCPLALTDVDEAGLEETAGLVSAPTLARPLDVSDRGAQLAFAAEVAEWAPAPIGAVFNNAGVALAANVADSSSEDEEWLRRINFEGVVHGTHAYLPILLNQRSGAIVNTSSVFGLAGIPGQSAYCASKFAVRGFTESLRHELVGSGVRAITVHPGGVRTNIARNGRLHSDPKGLGRSKDEIADEFEKIVRTTPDRAAEIIHRGVDAGRARILIGADAHVFDILTRVTPTHYFRVLSALEGALTRRSRKQQPRATTGS
jgi:NAD(P)-dependent dehydrogenase (short-subunit alcohol dehydrogenase family)